MVQQNVMALPAFMEMRHVIDFTIGKELARGGGGAVHMGEAKNGDILRQTNDHQIVVKTIFENPQDLEATGVAFEQEVSIMWLLQGEPNIAKVKSATLLAFHHLPSLSVCRLSGSVENL